MGTRGSFPGVKRLGRESDHSHPSSAEVKEWVELYLHSPIRFMAWCLVKAQGQLYLYIYLRRSKHLDVIKYEYRSIKMRTVYLNSATGPREAIRGRMVSYKPTQPFEGKCICYTYVSVAMTIEYTETSREPVGFLPTAITCCACQSLRTQPTAHKAGYCYLPATKCGARILRFPASGVKGNWRKEWENGIMVIDA
jgi:hypothetical protein